MLMFKRCVSGFHDYREMPDDEIQVLIQNADIAAKKVTGITSVCLKCGKEIKDYGTPMLEEQTQMLEVLSRIRSFIGWATPSQDPDEMLSRIFRVCDSQIKKAEAAQTTKQDTGKL